MARFAVEATILLTSKEPSYYEKKTLEDRFHLQSNIFDTQYASLFPVCSKQWLVIYSSLFVLSVFVWLDCC